ncbi:MAG: PAS domain-containing protein [Polyangiaceae bacterium]|nr:PAS domain-containing protein [Polyangiaceae bacterium]
MKRSNEESQRPAVDVSSAQVVLEAQRALFEDVFEASRDGIALIDAGGAARLNGAAARLFGCPGRTLPASWATEWCFRRADSREPTTPTEAGWLSADGRGAAVFTELEIHTGLDGDAVFVASNATARPVGGAIVVFRDIGPRIRARHELVAQRQRIEARRAERTVTLARAYTRRRFADALAAKRRRDEEKLLAVMCFAKEVSS